MPLLNVALVPAADQVVVRLTGEADLSTVPLITDALEQAAGLGTARVVVDVVAVHFWDCSGLHALAEFTADLAGAGRRCIVVGASPAAVRLVTLAGFASELELAGPVGVPGRPSGTPEHAVTGPGAPVPSDDRPIGAASAGPSRPPVTRHPARWPRRGEGLPTGEPGSAALAVTLRRWR